MQMKLLRNSVSLPSPLSLSIWWNGGSILGLLLAFQILTGLILSIHYTADMVNSFSSVIHIMRDTPLGWFVRSMHANGGSMYFIFMYMHMGRGLYYQSYSTQPHVWMVGVTILFVSMGTAFLGYVLPWGQMSFWGATVITNLISAVPYLGPSIVEWVWGGFSVGQPTLNRFYSLHFIMPFLIMGMSMLHLIFLHEKGSTNPLGDLNPIGKYAFHPYYTWKDSVGFLVPISLLLIISFYYPNVLGDPENFIPANPLVTPVHIMPEWYFLFAYAILRSIPSKLGGVIGLVMAVAVMYFLPIVNQFGKIVPSAYNLGYQLFYWIIIISFIFLTWLGACPIEAPFSLMSIIMTVIYFSSILGLLLSNINQINYE